jgi:hypothetical protein
MSIFQRQYRVKDMFWYFVPCSPIMNRRFGKSTVSIFWGPWVDKFSQLYYRGNTVTEPLHRGTLLRLEDHCLRGCFHDGISYRCLLDIVPCSTFYTFYNNVLCTVY